MKKTKSSKGKKLFIKKDVNGAMDPDTNPEFVETEQETGVVEETKKVKQKSKKSNEQPTAGESEEFLSGKPVPREDDNKAGETGPEMQRKTDTKVLENRGPWQETFADENTILIQRTVRSGQSIRFDGNVVVMGDVNPGSEIVASGNIVVMGALRGVVHAGALGDERATVAAFKLQPTQLRIANHITRAPDGDYLTPEYPEIARIKEGVVVIEVYQMGQDRQTKIG